MAVTNNEMLVALNTGALAIVPVGDGGFANEPTYVRKSAIGASSVSSSARVNGLCNGADCSSPADMAGGVADLRP